VTATLLRSGLISITQQDQQLAKLLFADAKSTLQNFATGLIRECLTCDPPLASQSQFRFTIEVLSQIMQTRKANEEWVSMFQTPRTRERANFDTEPRDCWTIFGG
jgi:CCR4-NOT transcription complex subunit 1